MSACLTETLERRLVAVKAAALKAGKQPSARSFGDAESGDAPVAEIVGAEECADKDPLASRRRCQPPAFSAGHSLAPLRLGSVNCDALRHADFLPTSLSLSLFRHAPLF